MRRDSRVDSNQADIRLALEKMGASVQSLATIGKGCPDMLICYRGILYLVEIKSEKGSLEKSQIKWHDDWGGPVKTIYSLDEAMSWIKELSLQRHTENHTDTVGAQ